MDPEEPTVLRPALDAVDPPRPPRAPPIGLLDAVRRSLAIVLLPAICLVAVAVVLGLLRKPTYTSQAQLNVGALNLSETSIEGYTTAVQYLAIGYAETIDANGVVAPVSAQLRVPASTVIDDVGAAAIPGSPVITVTAKSKDRQLATALANAASAALVSYAVKLNLAGNASAGLLTRYRQASEAVQQAIAQLQRAAPNTARQRAAQTSVDLARLQQQTQGYLYQQSQAGQTSENLVQQLAPASQPTSDRSSVLEQYAAGGLLGGLLIGIGLALERANRLARRRLRGGKRPGAGRARLHA